MSLLLSSPVFHSMRPALRAGLAICLAACRATSGEPGSAPAETAVPAVFPQGDVFPFMGYSGIPERDASHRFSAAGPDYSPDQEARLAAAERAGLSYPFKIGIDMKFHAKPPDKPLELTVDEIKRRITGQVSKVAGRKSICWWYLTPEEIRHWRKNEMEYLEAATEAIRAADPLKRPVWMYEPNHRDAASLRLTGRHLDIIGKGFYTNLAGYRDHRIWVRWSMDQQTQAIGALQQLDGRQRIPLVMPELCADPADPADDHLIPRWTRHDVYLGLMRGGKGVAIWSLFPRAEVRRTWQIHYDSYARLANELTGPLNLGRVFLQGTDAALIEISTIEGPRELHLTTGARNNLESGTTTDAEKQAAATSYPALGVRQLRFDGSIYVFLCNSSATETIKYQSSPFPDQTIVRDVFGYRPYPENHRKLYGWIAPLEVQCFRLTRSSASGTGP
jgi:hypothetical protein